MRKNRFSLSDTQSQMTWIKPNKISHTHTVHKNNMLKCKSGSLGSTYPKINFHKPLPRGSQQRQVCLCALVCFLLCICVQLTFGWRNWYALNLTHPYDYSCFEPTWHGSENRALWICIGLKSTEFENQITFALTTSFRTLLRYCQNNNILNTFESLLFRIWSVWA